ncbi:serine O-acetyltransferase [Gordonia aquimaris]|uniref:Serine acetyltransferase n=1 Tax=Gordonia aquimaris TaxID=2984863 RepID=A0A9X3I5U2_9ACTN|nr:hypothetical protein [Gordonia aquimaris]MCX2965385.1 hypothetical protein [Gordonia aquimaris]
MRLGFGLPFSFLYRLAGLFLFGIDIPTRTSVGKGISIHHGFGIVIHADSVIGDFVTIRQGVTIGATSRGAPIIRNQANLGASSLVIGPVIVGCNAVVGAGAVVVKDVPDGDIVVGNPAKSIRDNANADSRGEL